MTRLLSKQTKSTMYLPIIACRLNFVPLKRWARKKYQSRRSASVMLLLRALACAVDIPLSRLDFVEPPSPTRGEGIFFGPRLLDYSAAVAIVSSTAGGARLGASSSS